MYTNCSDEIYEWKMYGHFCCSSHLYTICVILVWYVSSLLKISFLHSHECWWLMAKQCTLYVYDLAVFTIQYWACDCGCRDLSWKACYTKLKNRAMEESLCPLMECVHHSKGIWCPFEHTCICYISFKHWFKLRIEMATKK